MSKYRKFILFATTLVATLAFVFTGGVINAQKLTVSGIDENGNVTSSKSYSEDGQDFYEVKIKANKKQAIYLLAEKIIPFKDTLKNLYISTILTSVCNCDCIFD